MDVKAGRYTANYPDGLLLSGVGVGMVMPSLSGAAVAHLPPIHYGVGSAFNQASRQIDGTLGVALNILLLGKDVISWADFCPRPPHPHRAGAAHRIAVLRHSDAPCTTVARRRTNRSGATQLDVSPLDLLERRNRARRYGFSEIYL